MSDRQRLRSEALEELRAAMLSHGGRAVGAMAARDDSSDPLNYEHCFVRDFAVAAPAYMAAGEFEVVRGFLETLVELQERKKQMDCFVPGQGLMPASFYAHGKGDDERLEADFGEQAIGRVTPVDSGMWWLWTLLAYQRATGDEELAQREDFQRAIRLILELCLTTRFEMFPTMLVPDGASTIDRRMGVYGHPIDIQSLFFASLRAARQLLDAEDPLSKAAEERIGNLAYHVRRFYWLDFSRLSELYRHRINEFGTEAVNRFNISPRSIPAWCFEWLPEHGGYFAGNLGPGRLDFRFFAQGNLVASLSGLASPTQADALLDMFEERWDDLIGEMPLKLCYPALEGEAWKLLTGYDGKNRPWSYHNGGNWPMLLWLFVALCRERGRMALAEAAVECAARRIARDGWPEYYDGRRGRMIGREARFKQTWSIGAMYAALDLLEDERIVRWYTFEDEAEVSECSAKASRRHPVD